MDEEYFDVVDENGQLTGEKVSRSEAHVKGIWHRTTYIYLFRHAPEGFFFLVHLRSKTKDQKPNTWITGFGGHVLVGDTVEETMRHELLEEAGVDMRTYKVITGATHKNNHFPDNEIAYSSFVEVPEDVPVKFNDGEAQRVEWMSASDIISSMQNRSREWAVSLEGFQEVLQILRKRYRV